MAGASRNVRAGRAFVEILLDQTALERGLKSAQAHLQSFGASMTMLGTQMLSIAAAATVPLAVSARTFASFDDEMRMARAVSSATDKEFSHLTATAEKLGRETSFTAKEVAEGMTAMGRMGFKADEIDNAISSVLNLARATGTELGGAAEIAANNMRVFGLSASQMASVADILTATANGSAQTLVDLAEGLKMAGPQAAAAGEDIGKVSAALGVLANMGIKGSLAGTALRKAYSRFANLNVQAKLAEFDISTIDNSGNLRAMPEIMADIARVMNSMPTAKKLAFAEEIFDLRGALAGLQLGGNIDQLDEFIRKLQDCNGAASETATEMDSGIGGAFRILQSAIEGVEISLGRIIGNAIMPFVRRTSLMLNKLAEWASAHNEVVISITKTTAVVAAAGTALIALGIAFKTIAFAVGTLNAAFVVMKTVVMLPVYAIQLVCAAYSGLLAIISVVKVAALSCWASISLPAVAAAAILSGLVAAVWKLSGSWDACKEAAVGFGNECRVAFAGIGQAFSDSWNAIKLAMASGDLASAGRVALSGLKLAWLTGILPLKKAWAEFGQYFSDVWTATVFSLLQVANTLWYGLIIGLNDIGSGIAETWQGIWDSIVDIFSSTCEFLEKQWVKFKGIFDDSETVGGALKAVEEKYANARAERQSASDAATEYRVAKSAALRLERARASEAINQAMAQEFGENQKKTDALIADAQTEINEAKIEWQAAMEAVRKAAEKNEARQEEARNKTAEAMAGTLQADYAAQNTRRNDAIGSWSLKELSSILGNSGDYDSRTANASESSVRLQQETNRYLRKMYSSMDMSYGG